MIMTQLTFLDPIARTTDPATSHLAAAEVAGKLGLLQSRFVQVIEGYGPQTAAEAARKCATVFGGMAESYRKRAAECCRLGALKTGGARNCQISGKPATVYVCNRS